MNPPTHLNYDGSKKSFLLSFILLLGLLIQSPKAQSFTNLADLGSNTFAVEESATTIAYTQSTNSLSFNGSFPLGATLGGVWAPSIPKNWSIYDLGDFGLILSVTGTNPSTPFTLELYDSSFQIVNTFIGSTFGATSSPSFSPLTLSLIGTGDMSDILGVQFTLNSPETINLNWESIGVVPEPNISWLLGLSALGLIVLRVWTKKFRV